MAVRNGITFSLVSLALTSLVFASAQDGSVSPFCGKALDKAFCTEVVKVAKTWQEAITEVLSETMMQTRMAEPIMANLLAHLPSTTDATTKNSIGETCRNSYGNVLDALNKVEEVLKTGDKTHSVNTQLSAAMTSLNDCPEEFKNIQMPDEFSAFFNGTKKLLSTCLAVERTRPDTNGVL